MQQTKSRPFRSGQSNSRRRPFSGAQRSNRNGSQRTQGSGNRSPRRDGNSFAQRGRKGRVMPTFDPSQFINKNPVSVTEEVYVPKHKFSDFAIDGRMIKTIKEMGIERPSPIQDQIIPIALEGHDVIGLAETGTGKTAAFLIPLIERTKHNIKGQTLILTPTRELALQVDQELKKLAKNFRFYSTVCVGGTSIGPQIHALRRQNQFVIGTPGRIMDLIERGKLDTRRITAVVLDEADRMLDMGFIHDMRKILADVPKERHTLFFSATMDERAKKLVGEFMVDPKLISVKKTDVTSSIAQDVVSFRPDQKFTILADLFTDESFKRVIVFGAMKHSVEKLARELTQSGISAESIHGNKNHSQRQRSLAKFKSGNARVLVATDVAARGIHVDNVSHVINYDLPNTFEDYVHRIGRTGRGDKKGLALTFVQSK